MQNISEAVLLPSRDFEIGEESELAQGEPSAPSAGPASSQDADALPQPSSADAQNSQSLSISQSADSQSRPGTRSGAPIIPALPQIPRSKPVIPQQEQGTPQTNGHSQGAETSGATVPDISPEAAPIISTRVIPKTWADLVRSKASAAHVQGALNGALLTNGTDQSRNGSIGEVLKQFDVDEHAKLPFLEPRGLVNTGNMCYMNSVSAE